MVIFDPAALPDGYDSVRQNPVETIEAAAKEGRIYWLDTASDGGYDLAVCMDGVRPEHARFARQIGVAERFAAPSGRLYFAGIEYMFRHDDSRLRKYPHMGSYQSIAPGVYRLTIYEMDYPEDFHEQLLRERIGPRSFRLYSLMGWFVPLGCLGALGLVAWLLVLGQGLWRGAAPSVRFVLILPVCVALILPIVVLICSRAYREAERVKLAIEAEFPGFLAVPGPTND